MLLHPHHGLCLLHFVKKGYSDDFTAQMERISKLLSDTNPDIALTFSSDAICEACPHNQKGVCETAKKVRSYDQAVLNLCGLKENDVLPYAAFRKLCKEKILRAGRLCEVCGDCCWAELCAQVSAKRYSTAAKNHSEASASHENPKSCRNF